MAVVEPRQNKEQKGLARKGSPKEVKQDLKQRLEMLQKGTKSISRNLSNFILKQQ